MNYYISRNQLFRMAMHDPFRYFGEVADTDSFGGIDMSSTILSERSGQSEGMRELYRRSRYMRLVREAQGGL